MVEYPIKLEVGYEEKASRLEALVIRWLYAIVLYIVLELWGIVAAFALFAQWIVIMITGARHQGLHSFIERYFRYYTRVTGYILLLTDERPPISGQ